MVKILRGNDGHLLTSEQQDGEIPIAAIAQRKLRFSMIFTPIFDVSVYLTHEIEGILKKGLVAVHKP